jgi:hypothetical protein
MFQPPFGFFPLNETAVMFVLSGIKIIRLQWGVDKLPQYELWGDLDVLIEQLYVFECECAYICEVESFEVMQRWIFESLQKGCRFR